MKRAVLTGLIGLGLLLMLGAAPTSSLAGSSVPLPSNIEIIPPEPGLAPEIAAFSGKWEGTWESGRDCILIVEKIDGQRARVIYAWSDDKNCPEGAPKGFRRYLAKVNPGPPATIEFGGNGYTKFTFEMQKNFKSLKGLWETSRDYGKGKMKRLEN